jgi:hypothetical protein
MDTDDVQVRRDRRTDFDVALRAGNCSTLGTADSDRFDELFDSAAFNESGLYAVALGLKSKIDQLLSLNQLVRDAFNYGRRFEEVYSRICREHGVDPDNFPKVPFEGSAWVAPGASFVPPDNDIVLSKEQSAVAPVLERRIRDWQVGAENHPTTVGYMTGNLHVAGLAAMEWPRTNDAIQAFYRALITQAWTVFESHSEDLWEAAVNAHPKTLADLGGKGSAFPSDLLKYDFAVKDKMGTILKDRQKLISFRSLEKIQGAYALAFSEKGSAIASILEAPTLRYAAAVRSLVVHKRGIVDGEFRKQTSGIVDVPMVEEGNPFPISGQLCAQLSDACPHAATCLLLAVHAWIVGHSEKGKVGA